MYVGRELEKETPNESNHPGDFECQQYLHLVVKDLGTKNGPGDRLLLDIYANELISSSLLRNMTNSNREGTHNIPLLVRTGETGLSRGLG
jgi:hypothetical protein